MFIALPALGGVDPFPFGKEIKFPWKSLPGTWQVAGFTSESLFGFKINTNASGDKDVDINLVLRSNPCTAIAHGKGVLNGKFITAQMVSEGRAFNLTIHAFNSSDVSGVNVNQGDTYNTSPLRSGTTNDKVVMALTVFPIGEPDQRSAFEISRIAYFKTPVCR
jgi:hypothetical protein